LKPRLNHAPKSNSHRRMALPHLDLSLCVFKRGPHGEARKDCRAELIHLTRDYPLHQQKRAERAHEG
jgi:hypothetical protein